MQDLILEIINQYGYFGIFLLITIENVFPPIPSEIILTFGGFLTTYTAMSVWGVVLAATIGSVAGAIILYLIGRILNAERLAQLLNSRLGKLLRLDPEDVRMAERWFGRHGNKAVLLCRCVPIVRSLISLPAGMARMPMGPFLSLTVIGTLVWNSVLVWLGRAAGSAWETIARYVDTYSMIALALLVVLALVVAAMFIKKRFLQSK
ncbi:MAG: DedA family protein [Firmicutes bacterium]|nr:DedA family protein [Bacillota bacterium]